MTTYECRSSKFNLHCYLPPLKLGGSETREERETDNLSLIPPTPHPHPQPHPVIKILTQFTINGGAERPRFKG